MYVYFRDLLHLLKYHVIIKVSYNWLNEYLNFSVSQQEIASVLTSTGLEVEGLIDLFTSFDHLAVGKVIECIAHPNTDKL